MSATVTAEDGETFLRVLDAIVDADKPDDNRPGGAGGNAQITRSAAVMRDAWALHGAVVTA